MDKAALGVGVETGAEHAHVILARTFKVFYAEHLGGYFEEIFSTAVFRSSVAMVR